MRKLKLLFAALALLGVSSVNAYQTPTADGIYYLYNTACTDGTPGFMSTGNGYGFQVVIDNFGFPVKLISTGADNTYQFQFIHHEGFLSDDGWMYSDGGNTGENPRARTITVQDQGNGTYKLINTNNSKEIEDWYGNVVGDGTGNRHNYLWQFLSKAERDAIVAGYTTSVKTAAATSMGMPASVDDADKFDAYLSTNYIGIDVSAKIQNGTFDTNHNTTGWTTSANDNRNFNIGWGNTEPKTTPEVYEGAGAISQTVTVDKVGLYKVSVNATYRCGNNDNNNRIGDLGFDGSVAYLKANDNIAKIPDWYSGKINGNGPGSPSEANSTYFSAGKYLTEVFVYVGDAKTIDISLHSHAHTWGGWLMFNNFKLTYYSDVVSDDDATAILTTANGLIAQEMDAEIKSNLTSAKNTFDGARTVANYNALNALIPEAQASVDAYALFAPERTKALALGMTSEAIAALAPNVNNLKVAEYNFVTTNYSHSVELGAWTTTGETATNKGQHWDGTGSSTYLEQLNRDGDNPAGWHATAWKVGYNQNVELPAGNYVFKVAGRRSSSDLTLSLVVKKEDDVIGTVNDFPMGDTGKGIDTSGATNFGDGTYANNGTGRGFEWRYVKFTLADPATVNVAVSAVATAKYQWMSFCNPTVQTDNADNVAIMEALVALNSAKTNATLTKNTNVGTGVFQLNEDTNNSLWTAYSTAKTNADKYSFTSSSTASEINALATALNNATNNYNNQALNAPEASKRYNLSIIDDGKAWNGNAITFIAGGRNDMGNYAIQYLAPANSNLNQALKFTAVDGEVNTYKVSAINAETGNEQYITTGSTYDGGNNSQIRTTDDASKSSWVKIKATEIANQFQLLNVSDGNKVIANNNDNGVYTAGNANFTIAEAAQASVSINIAAAVKYGTCIFPFTPVLPAAVKAYSCAETAEGVLTLAEIATPEANKPYILEAESGYTGDALTGWGIAGATTVSEGLLTGVYANTLATKGTYVLQNKNNVVAFYKVAEDSEPTIGANHCYLTAPASARDAFFFDGDATAINTIEALTSGKCTIFNANGAKVPALQKGVNILKTADGQVRKVIVK